MKTLQRLLLVGLSTLVLSLPGCKEYKIEYSDVKHENAIVSLHEYFPENTSIDFGFDGKMSINTNPAEYNIEFKGKIIFKLNNKQVFDRFQLEDLVEVSYKEIHGKTYGRDGKTRYLESDEIVGNEFVDAKKR
jgi:hypothetical protein